MLQIYLYKKNLKGSLLEEAQIINYLKHKESVFF